MEGRLQGTRKIPLAKVGIPSAFRRREDVNVHHVAIQVAPMGKLSWVTARGVPTSQEVPLPFGALSSDAGEVSICCSTSLVLWAGFVAPGTVEIVLVVGSVTGMAGIGGISLCGELASGGL